VKIVAVIDGPAYGTSDLFPRHWYWKQALAGIESLETLVLGEGYEQSIGVSHGTL
jgi:hypothetical protein